MTYYDGYTYYEEREHEEEPCPPESGCLVCYPLREEHVHYCPQCWDLWSHADTECEVPSTYPNRRLECPDHLLEGTPASTGDCWAGMPAKG